MEDQLLVWQCKRGSGQALARIYEKYKEDLVCLAMALLNDGGAAEDVLHDVMVGFAQGIRRFRLTGSLKGYLLTCAANRARNLRRGQRPTCQVSDALQDCVQESAPAVDRVVANEELQILARALEQLSPDQREAVALHLYGQMSFRVVAQTLDVPVSTAKSRYQQGLKRLRQLLDSEVDHV